MVSDVAARFDKSYSEDASKPVKRGDAEWQPLIRIITKYIRSDLPQNREPLVFARFPALADAKKEYFKGQLFEWTAPATPVALVYKDWPAPPADYRIVGTIGDLHDWIRRDEADFDFLIRTIIFGLLSVCVGVFLALRA